MTINIINKVGTLESIMQDLPQADIPTTHDFMGGMYARTIYLKKGMLLTGAIHLTDHLNIVTGDITIAGESGQKRYTGTHIVPSKAGTKRVGLVHEDTTWTTILKTNLTEVNEIESTLVTTEFNDPRLENQIIEMIGE